jgi:hypothetical protein
MQRRSDQTKGSVTRNNNLISGSGLPVGPSTCSCRHFRQGPEEGINYDTERWMRSAALFQLYRRGCRCSRSFFCSARCLPPRGVGRELQFVGGARSVRCSPWVLLTVDVGSGGIAFRSWQGPPVELILISQLFTVGACCHSELFPLRRDSASAFSPGGLRIGAAGARGRVRPPASAQRCDVIPLGASSISRGHSPRPVLSGVRSAGRLGEAPPAPETMLEKSASVRVCISPEALDVWLVLEPADGYQVLLPFRWFSTAVARPARSRLDGSRVGFGSRSVSAEKIWAISALLARAGLRRRSSISLVSILHSRHDRIRPCAAPQQGCSAAGRGDLIPAQPAHGSRSPAAGLHPQAASPPADSGRVPCQATPGYARGGGCRPRVRATPAVRPSPTSTGHPLRPLTARDLQI